MEPSFNVMNIFDSTFKNQFFTVLKVYYFYFILNFLYNFDNSFFVNLKFIILEIIFSIFMLQILFYFHYLFYTMYCWHYQKDNHLTSLYDAFWLNNFIGLTCLILVNFIFFRGTNFSALYTIFITYNIWSVTSYYKVVN